LSDFPTAAELVSINRFIGLGRHSFRVVITDELETPVDRMPTVDFHVRTPLPKSALP